MSGEAKNRFKRHICLVVIGSVVMAVVTNAKAFEIMRSKEKNCGKVILVP